jgi:membrane protein DedA with SNARE-associated domain
MFISMTENAPSFVDLMIQWLANNPGWSGLAVFLISLGESLVVVGLFIPGTVVMFGIGALVAMGGMNLWDTLLWSILGAIVGDGISFWVGHHYREAMRGMYPFNRHPEWLERAEVFFARHGGKSVVFGRFIGPVRPIIPVVAGMMGMTPAHFYVVNVISALLWAPAYILPGVVLGASLSLAAGVTTRLAILVVLVIGVVWLTAWLVGQISRQLQPHAYRMMSIFLKKFFPNQSDTHILMELGIILIIAAGFFVTLLMWQRPLSIDSQVYFLFQNLRTPWVDHLMVFIISLGTLGASLWVASLGFGWLIWQQHWRALGYWIAALAFGVLTAAALHLLMPLFPPALSLEEGNPLFFKVDLTIVVLLYGFWAVLIAHELSTFWRLIPYLFVSVLIVGELIASLYLAQSWLSDGLVNIALSLIWVAFLGLAYRRLPTSPVRYLRLSAALIIGIVAMSAWHFSFHHAETVKRHVFEYPTFFLDAEKWWKQDWDQLSLNRVDWAGEAVQPFTVQYAGDLNFLRDHLLAQGWQDSPAFTAAATLQWLNPDAKINELPVLPKVHDGQHEILQLMKIDGSSRWILRLWKTHTILSNQKPVWAGQVTRETLKKSLEIMALPRAEPDLFAPLEILKETVREIPQYSPKNHLLLLHQP